MRRFVLGDVHGAYKALIQCLERSQFDYENDLLISLGDICDGWPETNECFEELLKIKNLILILGNHDQWALEWMEKGKKPDIWLSQGGRQTMESYSNSKPPESHIEILKNAKVYHLTDDNRLFVHAGIDPEKELENQDEHELLWDRGFYNEVSDHIPDEDVSFTSYKNIYLGHSPIHRMGYYKPLRVGEVWLMDTGAAWDGTLSIMNIDTEEAFVSDKPVDMYPAGSGRF